MSVVLPDTVIDIGASNAPDRCADEPIRFGGFIQPTGVLLCVDNQSQTIIAATTNHGMIPFLSFPILGRTVGELWPHSGEMDKDNAFSLGDEYKVLSHSDGLTTFIEIEPCTQTDRLAVTQIVDITSALVGLHTAGTLEAVTDIAATAIRRITGMERILIYRFDKDGHGEVVAESKVDDWHESFIGFHFPSADIPAQARDLYLVSPCRFVEKRDYQPVPLVPELDPRSGQPFDLGRCRLRSLSPMHRLYQENLGVDGYMSVSILHKGLLWGLVVGHHRQPYRVAIPAREQVLALTAGLSMCLGETESAADQAARSRHVVLHSKLLEQIAGADDFVSPLMSGEVTLADLFGSSGGAVVARGHDTDGGPSEVVHTLGRCPDRELINATATACRELMVDGVFHTDAAASVLPILAGHADIASGVLAMTIGESSRHMVLWFRPETIRTIAWGGASPEEVAQQKSTGNWLPRTSFGRWLEERRGRSLPWQPWQIEICRSLRAALNDVVLRHVRTLRTLEVKAALHQSNKELGARTAELEVSNRELNSIVYAVAHNLHGPLRAMNGFSHALAEAAADKLAPDELECLQQIGLASEQMGLLIDGLLTFSRYMRAELQLNEIDITAIAEQFRDNIGGSNLVRHVTWYIQPNLTTIGDRRLIEVVMTNLLSNAWKFTSRTPNAEISLAAEAEGGQMWFTVTDNGAGFDMEHADRLFQLFQRLHRQDEFEGIGMGLAAVHRIVQRHGGDIRVTSTVGGGARFSFFLAAPDRST